jgi:glyceraldehyde 3-phosphate dehydrogenase
MPELKGKLDGMAIRVPTPNVSIVDFVADVNSDTTISEVNNMFKLASKGNLSGILDYEDTPLVSIDYNGNKHSSIVDGLSTKVIDKRLVKVLAWYDNECGYSSRVCDLLKLIVNKGL